MEELSLILYTSVNNTSIAKLFVQEFNKFSDGLSIPKYIVSNNFKCETDFDSLGFKKINCNIPHCDGGTHFTKVMLNSLNQIDSDYILFFLEDYILMKNIKVDTLNNILNFMKNENVDHISLMSYEGDDWELLDIDYKLYNLDDDIFVKMNEKYLYMFSVQPCIWKKDSLIKILENNINVSINSFDTSYIKNMKGQVRNVLIGENYETPSDFWDYNFKHIALKKNPLTTNYAFDEHNGEDDYLLFLYSEIMRHGKFNVYSHDNNKIFINNFLLSNNITSDNKEYSKYFHND
jgi:hypothetical protein